MLLEGILALQAGENPRVVRDKLSAFLPPRERAEEGAEAKA
jgi:chemotaxis protein MotA